MLLVICILLSIITITLVTIGIVIKYLPFHINEDFSQTELVNIVTYRKFLFKEYNLVDVSTDQEVFTIETNVPNIEFRDLSKNTEISYNDETALYVFRILCVCYDIDPYNYFTFTKKPYQSFIETFDSSIYISMQNTGTTFTKYMVKYSAVQKDKLLFYIPFVRFHSVQSINNLFYSLILLDKVYVSKHNHSNSLLLKVCPYPDLGDKNAKNVYLKEGFVLNDNFDIQVNIETDLKRLGGIDYNLKNNIITITVNKNDGLKYIKFLKDNDVIILSKQEIPKWNGKYRVDTVDLEHNVIKLVKKGNGNGNENMNDFLSKLLIKDDNMCYDDSECPFYNPNTGNGGCESGYCKMPVGVNRISFKDYEKDKTPFCFGCIDELHPRCCSDAERYFFM